MKKVILTALVGLSVSSMALAGGYEDGEKMANSTCVGCHGKNGVSAVPTFPSLAGQYPNYVVHALEQYKSGERKNPIMNGQAKNLSDEDIHNLALFFSKQSGGVSVAPHND